MIYTKCCHHKQGGRPTRTNHTLVEMEFEMVVVVALATCGVIQTAVSRKNARACLEFVSPLVKGLARGILDDLGHRRVENF